MDDQQPDWRGNGSRFLSPLGVNGSKTSRLAVGTPKSDRATKVDVVTVAKGLVENFSLREVELYRCGVTGEGASSLSQALSVNKYVSYLGLARNPCAAGFGGDALAEALKVNQTLKVLDLSWTDCGDETAAAFAEALLMNNSLQRLYLDRNAVGCDGAGALATALVKNTKLKHLSLSNNKVRAAGISLLGQGVARSSTLTTLDVSMNGIPEPGMFSLFHALAVSGAPSLFTLNVSYNVLGASCAMAAVFIRRSATLREVCFESCSLTEGAEFRVLCDAIAHSKSLSNLSLACNEIRDGGVKQLSAAILGAASHPAPLRYLDLSETVMTAAVLSDLSKSLNTLSSLSTLHISRSDLSGNGKALGVLISESPSLRFVGAANCKLGFAGFDALIGHLKYSSLNVTGLSLRGNKAGDDGIALLLPVAIHHGRFEYLDISGNDATSVTVARLNDVLEANPRLQYIAVGDQTIVSRDNMYLPWRDLDGKQPGTCKLALPPHCAAPADVDPSSFAPSAGFSTYSAGVGSAVKRHCEGLETPITALLDVAGKPVKHTELWRGVESAAAAPDLTSPVFSNHITHSTSVEFENNLAGLLTSDDQLRREFNRLDTNGNGFLEAGEMSMIYSSLEHFGVRYSKRDLDRIIKAVAGDATRIDFDRFCVLYLQLVKA